MWFNLFVRHRCLWLDFGVGHPKHARNTFTIADFATQNKNGAGNRFTILAAAFFSLVYSVMNETVESLAAASVLAAAQMRANATKDMTVHAKYVNMYRMNGWTMEHLSCISHVCILNGEKIKILIELLSLRNTHHCMHIKCWRMQALLPHVAFFFYYTRWQWERQQTATMKWKRKQVSCTIWIFLWQFSSHFATVSFRFEWNAISLSHC